MIATREERIAKLMRATGLDAPGPLLPCDEERLLRWVATLDDWTVDTLARLLERVRLFGDRT